MDQEANNTDNTEPLKPRFALTANKCERLGCEDFHLMIFGGTTDSEYEVIAETALGKQDQLTAEQCNDLCTCTSYFYTVGSFDFKKNTMKVNKP